MEEEGRLIFEKSRFTHTHTHIHHHTNTHTHTHTHSQTNPDTHTSTHTHTHTHTNAHTNTHAHAHAHVHTHTYIHTHKNTNKYTPVRVRENSLQYACGDGKRRWKRHYFMPIMQASSRLFSVMGSLDCSFNLVAANCPTTG